MIVTIFERLGIRETAEDRLAREEAKKAADTTAWEARIRAGGARVEAEQLAVLAGFLPASPFSRERTPEEEARVEALRKALGKPLEGGGGGPSSLAPRGQRWPLSRDKSSEGPPGPERCLLPSHCWP